MVKKPAKFTNPFFVSKFLRIILIIQIDIRMGRRDYIF